MVRVRRTEGEEYPTHGTESTVGYARIWLLQNGWEQDAGKPQTQVRQLGIHRSLWAPT